MWIILEGPDGAGKSTLAREIATCLESRGARVVSTHTGPPSSPETALAECVESPYREYLPDNSADCIVTDRWSWGELVYGPIFRPQQNIRGFGAFGRGGWRYAELFAAARGAYVVLLNPPTELVAERLSARGDDMVNVSQLGALSRSYTDVFDLARMSAGVHIQTDVPRDMLPGLADTIVLAAAAREQECADNGALTRLRAWPDYVGKPDAPKLVPTTDLLEDQVLGLSSLGEDQWRDVGLLPGGRGLYSRS